MITLQEAIRIAEEWNPKYDTYQEYDDAYVFFIDDGIIRYGGGDNCLIVEKANGNKLHFAQYYMDANREITEVGEPVSFKPCEKTIIYGVADLPKSFRLIDIDPYPTTGEKETIIKKTNEPKK